jgi:hypothetical protein
VEDNKQLVENHKLTTDDEIEKLQSEVHQLLRSKIEVRILGMKFALTDSDTNLSLLIQDDHSTGETPRRTSYNIPSTLAPRVSNEEMIRRFNEAATTNVSVGSAEEIIAPPRASIERDRSQLSHQQEREPSHIKAEAVSVKEEKDLVDVADLQSYPKSTTQKSIRSESRFTSSRGLFAYKANTNEVPAGNEPALRDKTNGDRFKSSGSSLQDTKLSKRRLPTEATDALYKRRRAPESTFWRS